MRNDEDVRATSLELPADTPSGDLPAIEEVRIRPTLQALLGPVEHAPEMAIRLRLLREA